MRKTALIPLILILGPALGCSKKTEPAQAAGGLHISGRIELDPKLAKQAKGSDVIYLIAKPAAGGPTVAVKRFEGKSYPYAFTLTDQDRMMPDAALEGPLNLAVRADKDGDAMTKTPGDLVGEYAQNPVALDAADVVVTVNEVLK